MVFSTINSSSNSAATVLRRKRPKKNNATTQKQTTRLAALFTCLPLNALLGAIIAFGAWNGFVSLTKLQAEESSRHMQEETMSLFAKSVAAKDAAATHPNNGKDKKNDETNIVLLNHASDSLPNPTNNNNTELAADPEATRRRLYERLAKSTSRGGKSFSLSTPDSPCPHITGKEKSSIGGNSSSISTVEFSGCCGLGHRLLRMSCAAHVAQKLNAQFYGHWGCCNDKEVFTEMFGETALLQPFKNNDEDSNQDSPTENKDSKGRARPDEQQQQQQQQQHLQSVHQPNHLMFRFEVTGFESIYKEKRRFLNRTREIIDTRNNKSSTCPVKCSPDKIRSDYRFYTALMQRYRQRHIVDAFVREHFKDKLALGLHIRAGNDEKGDFERKGRVITNKQGFVQDTIAILNQLVANANASTGNATRPPILFIATDTPSYIDAFRHGLKDVMSVVDLPHVIRQTEGQGVLFGEMVTVKTSGDDCLKGWQSAFEDMMILSQTDIVLAPKHSSFTQTMPLSILLGRPRNNNRISIAAPFCETLPITSQSSQPQTNQTKQIIGITTTRGVVNFQCYESVQDWCCRNAIPRAAYFNVKPDWRDSL